MDENRAVELLNKALRCMQTDPGDCEAQCKKCKNYAAKEDGIEAIRTAIKALGKDIDVPSKSALDHIHNVVRDDAYRRGYERGKKDAAPTWIPTSERVPSNNDTVLIVHKGGVSTGWWNGRYWERGASSNHRMLKTVTHWMPFPKAPKGN